MVEVLVGQRGEQKFSGFLAQFEGEKISSYEDKRDGKNIVYTLYRCTAYNWEAYRVHIADESDPENPVYKLEPYSEDQDIRGVGPDYTEPYAKEQLAYKFPLFLKDMKYFRERPIDPQPRSL